MRRSLLVWTTALVLLVRVPAQGQGLAFDVFRDYLEALRSQTGIPGMAAAIVGPDGIVWERAYGRQDVSHNIATRTDTPFHVDQVTQLFTAAMVLECVEEGRLSLEDKARAFQEEFAEPDATVRQLLSHTSGPPGAETFSYRPERLEPLWFAVRKCTEDSYRETLANLLRRLAMMSSVPGQDIVQLPPLAEGIPDAEDVVRYEATLERLAQPYALDAQRRASISKYPSVALTPGTGLISTVRDIAEFDLALRQGLLLSNDMLQKAWQPASGAGGVALPHGLGWFVQSFNGEKVVWQFGLSENASSSLVITLPGRGLTLVLLANSDRLVKPFTLAAGDLTVSPFGYSFLSLFAR